MAKSTRTENRYAVCIGINNYSRTAGLSTLRYAEDDARAMDVLLARLGFPDDNRRLLLGEAASLDAINSILGDIILDRPNENDLVLFYFAGHSKPLAWSDPHETGNDGSRGEVFLAPYDFDANKIRQSRSFRSQHALGMKRLRETFFAGEGSRKRLFIFDSCYSGDFFGPQYRDEFDPVQGYIKQMLDSKSAGRVALSSCLPIQKAREDAALRHGLFTYYLLKALSGEDADALRRDGCLTVNTLFEYIADHLPEDQRPVLSGVQQDTFELTCYPQHAQIIEQEEAHGKIEQDRRHEEKVKRLLAMFADHSSFMRDRLESFVGRQKELEEIQQRIQERIPTGGYVTITGQAGQGKSSIIAQLVNKYIAEQGAQERVAYHFIPFNPGPDHQVGLLRNLIARLMYKYDLSDLYVDYVAYGTRPALRDFFPHILQEIADKGAQEIIFIDGLDQLEEDFNGVRDLTFLPTDPPPGIVFVLGTRPNDTLHPLELLKPHSQYVLPNLGRTDFDLILQHRGVSLSPEIADQFYLAMQENALFLDLVAKELTAVGTKIAPDEMIHKLANDPKNLFSFAIARLKRAPEWEDIEQVLGILLASREPLALQHIRNMLGIKDHRLRRAIALLGGLLTESTPTGQYNYHSYSLFHLIFRDFLEQNEQESQRDYLFATNEVQSYHTVLVKWCQGEQLALVWQESKDQLEQSRRVYARQHYINHLYFAKQWQQLFGTLDEVSYGRAKLEYDPSMHAFALDLERGRIASASNTWTLEQGIAHLPVLWRYTLLQCSLANRADNYPDEALQLLLLLGQEGKAVGLAELLTDASRKVKVFIRIAEHLAKQSGREVESQQRFLRAYEVARSIEEARSRSDALSNLGQALTKTGQWERAQAVIVEIEDALTRGIALRELGQALIEADQWDRAEVVIEKIEDDESHWRVLGALVLALAKTGQWDRAQAVISQFEDASWQEGILLPLAQALVDAGQWDHAQAIWKEAETEISELEDAYWRGYALRVLGQSLFKAGQRDRAKALWKEAEAVIAQIEDAKSRGYSKSMFGKALAEAGEWSHAQALWQEAESAIAQIKDAELRGDRLRALVYALAKTGQWEYAKAVINKIENTFWQKIALRDLGWALVEARQWDRVETMLAEGENGDWLEQVYQSLVEAGQWDRAQAVIAKHEDWDDEERGKALSILGAALAEADQWDRAETAIDQIEGAGERADVLRALSFALIDAGQWDRARAVIARMENWDRTRWEASKALGQSLARAEQWERAEAVWREAEAVIVQIEDADSRYRDEWMLGVALAKAGQWERLEAVIARIADAEEREWEMRDLVKALIDAEQWEHAEALIAKNENFNWEEELSALAKALIETDQWEYAEAMVARLAKFPGHEDMLIALVEALARAGQWDRAEAVISRITDDDVFTKGDALIALTEALAEGGQHKRAMSF